MPAVRFVPLASVIFSSLRTKSAVPSEIGPLRTIESQPAPPSMVSEVVGAENVVDSKLLFVLASVNVVPDWVSVAWSSPELSVKTMSAAVPEFVIGSMFV
ncbi:hypothetical protein GCM10012320_23240 [Sinomonas cellulolyticus]|nr:hypothetical protein GCM10012320_23240 [Sinomonas sp. KCTC 49339]